VDVPLRQLITGGYLQSPQGHHIYILIIINIYPHSLMLKIPSRGRNLRSSGRPDVVLHKVLQISLVKVMRFRLAVNGAVEP